MIASGAAVAAGPRATRESSGTWRKEIASRFQPLMATTANVRSTISFSSNWPRTSS